MSYLNLHTAFKLAGKSFKDYKELLDFTNEHYSLINQFLLHWLDTSEYLTVNTSGSTGKPKAIQLKKSLMINSAKATGNFFDLQPKTTALLCLPTNFIAGKMMLVRAMVLGWHLDVVAPNANPLFDDIKEYDFSAMVPLQLFNSINNIFKIKKLIVGGGVVSKDLQSKILDVQTKIYATYGMTETITHIAVQPLNRAAGLTFENNTYQTLPNVNISKDKRNCLVIDAPKVSEHIVKTNDLVDIISESKFKWLGRYDNIINSGGVKLIPEQIEEKLTQIILQRFFVTGIPDDLLGESLVLIIEGKHVKLSKEMFRAVLSPFEIPKQIFFVENFKETETKKIDRISTMKMIFN